MLSLAVALTMTKERAAVDIYLGRIVSKRRCVLRNLEDGRIAGEA